MTRSPDEILSELRVDIDRIDADMHALLIERGDIIERLIAVKARQGGGSAFRPGREAEMMRRIAERHTGPLPLDTVESIWRVIIATFTFVQAPFAVHADMSQGDAAVRDTARFHFGFTVPLRAEGDAAAVIEAVGAAESDLGIIPVAAGPSDTPWWPRLAAEGAPKIIARLPFVERRDHPAALPVFVIARPTAAVAVRDIVVLLVTAPVGADLPAIEGGASTLGTAGRQRLIAVPGPGGAALAESLRTHGLDVAELGSHAARYSIETASVAAA